MPTCATTLADDVRSVVLSSTAMSDTKILGVQTAGAVNHLGVGDPSCDLVIAWTFLDAAGRKAFRQALTLDSATWDRARGWAIWNALVILDKCRDTNSAEAARHHKVIRDVIDDQLAS